MRLTSLRSLRRSCIAVLFLGFLAAEGCRPTPAPEGQARSRDTVELDRLLQLMKQRLTLMDDVARWKWNSGQAITDPQRERELLDKVVERGREKGLDADLVRRFFAAQMEAARTIQQADFDRWSATKQKPFADATNLSELRKQIDALNEELIDALAAISARLSEPSVQDLLRQRADAILSGENLTAVRATVIGPLKR